MMDATPFAAILGVLVLVCLFGIGMYNGLVRARNETRNIFGSVDAMLKKRFDLIPNLVASVQEYVGHEERTLVQLTSLRARAADPRTSPGERVKLDGDLTRGLSALFATVEAYPALRASENFLNLQQTLHEVEEQLAAARRAYNATVTDYNNRCQTFPSNIVAGLFAFRPMPILATPDVERVNPDVKSLFKRAS